jgi:hypothetical protein
MGLAGAIALLALPGRAMAEDVTGRVGIGFDTAITGATGVSATYGVVPRVAVQGIYAFESESGGGMMGDTSSTVIEIGARGIFSFIQRGHVGVGLVGGLGILRSSFESGGVSNASTEISIELGLRPEWFVTEHFSVHGSFGARFASSDGSSEVAIGDGGVLVNIFGAADLLGNAGFTFYF